MSSSCTQFSDLPKELALRVLSFLSLEELRRFVAPVCKEWLTLANDPYLRLHLCFTEKNPPTQKVRTQLLKSPVLHSTTIVKRSDANSIINEIHLKCPVLYSLSLHECSVDEKHLSKIAPQLQTLIIGRDTTFLADLTTLVPLMTQLKHIHILDQHCYLYRKFKPILSTNIVSVLYIDGGSYIHDDDVNVITRMKHLRHLIIDVGGVSERGLKMLCMKSSRLYKFGLTNAWVLTDSCLDFISDSLGWIRIHQSRRVTAKGLQKLFQRMEKLYHLDLDDVTSVTDSVVQVIGLSCKALNVLGLSRCVSVTDDGITLLIHNLKYLGVLDLSWNTQLKGGFLATCGHMKITWFNFYLCINIPRDVLDNFKKKNSHVVAIGCAKPFPEAMVADLKDLAEITRLRTGSQRTKDGQLGYLFRHPFCKSAAK